MSAICEARRLSYLLCTLLVGATVVSCGAAGRGVRSASPEPTSAVAVATPEDGQPEAQDPQAAAPGAEVEPAEGAPIEEEGDSSALRTVPTEASDLSDGTIVVAGDDWANNSTGAVGVTLARETVFPPFLWVANHSNNTVSRVNTETGREEGRYWVGQNPSRTAVDLDGNVWIGGRNDGRLTKVLWDVSQCPDRNGDGVVRTANAENMGPLNSQANPYADECVVYSEIPTPEQPSIRGIAAGPDGRVWFGFTAGGVQSIHPESFELGPHVPPQNVPVFRRNDEGTYLPVVDTQGERLTAHGGGVYGLVVDREGFLYSSSMRRNTLTRFNIFSGRWDAVYENTGCQNYGISIDGRDRVWLGCTGGSGGVLMFDPSRQRTHRFGIPTDIAAESAVNIPVAYGPDHGHSNQFGVTGLGVEPATGNVWASFWRLGFTGRLSLDEGNLSESTWTLIEVAPSTDLRGVGFDHEGFAWTHGVSRDLVWKINPRTNRLAEGYEAGRPVGEGGHYTYSDFTGSTGLSFTTPRGLWRFTVEPATGAGAPLRALRWEGFLPENTLAEIRIRPLNEEGGPAGSWVPEPTDIGAAVYQPFETGSRVSIFDLSARNLRAERFEVEVRLSTSGQERPVVNSVELLFDPAP